MKALLKKIVKAILPYGILWLYWKQHPVRIAKKRKKDDDREKKKEVFCRHFLKTTKNGENYFEIAGAKLPDVRNNTEAINTLIYIIFPDVFLFPYFLNDNYDKSFVETMDIYMTEGPYGYKDGNFDVAVKKDDIVIDAGAWIGDFSAYSSCKGAISYAFEPINSTYELLQKTAVLNSNIYPVKKGLSNKKGVAIVNISETNSATNQLSSVSNSKRSNLSETISLTTLDEFVEENKISRVDFIKADIEGAERDMLKGAQEVLRKFASKLAICTYHLPDDPKVLEKIILEANPNYKVIHLKNKLFAQVV